MSSQPQQSGGPKFDFSSSIKPAATSSVSDPLDPSNLSEERRANLERIAKEKKEKADRRAATLAKNAQKQPPQQATGAKSAQSPAPKQPPQQATSIESPQASTPKITEPVQHEQTKAMEQPKQTPNIQVPVGQSTKPSAHSEYPAQPTPSPSFHPNMFGPTNLNPFQSSGLSIISGQSSRSGKEPVKNPNRPRPGAALAPLNLSQNMTAGPSQAQSTPSFEFSINVPVTTQSSTMPIPTENSIFGSHLARAELKPSAPALTTGNTPRDRKALHKEIGDKIAAKAKEVDDALAAAEPAFDQVIGSSVQQLGAQSAYPEPQDDSFTNPYFSSAIHSNPDMQQEESDESEEEAEAGTTSMSQVLMAQASATHNRPAYTLTGGSTQPTYSPHPQYPQQPIQTSTPLLGVTNVQSHTSNAPIFHPSMIPGFSTLASTAPSPQNAGVLPTGTYTNNPFYSTSPRYQQQPSQMLTPLPGVSNIQSQMPKAPIFTPSMMPGLSTLGLITPAFSTPFSQTGGILTNPYSSPSPYSTYPPPNQGLSQPPSVPRVVPQNKSPFTTYVPPPTEDQFSQVTESYTGFQGIHSSIVADSMLQDTEDIDEGELDTVQDTIVPEPMFAPTWNIEEGDLETASEPEAPQSTTAQSDIEELVKKHQNTVSLLISTYDKQIGRLEAEHKKKIEEFEMELAMVTAEQSTPAVSDDASDSKIAQAEESLAELQEKYSELEKDLKKAERKATEDQEMYKHENAFAVQKVIDEKKVLEQQVGQLRKLEADTFVNDTSSRDEMAKDLSDANDRIFDLEFHQSAQDDKISTLKRDLDEAKKAQSKLRKEKRDLSRDLLNSQNLVNHQANILEKNCNTFRTLEVDLATSQATIKSLKEEAEKKDDIIRAAQANVAADVEQKGSNNEVQTKNTVRDPSRSSFNASSRVYQDITGRSKFYRNSLKDLMEEESITLPVMPRSPLSTKVYLVVADITPSEAPVEMAQGVPNIENAQSSKTIEIPNISSTAPLPISQNAENNVKTVDVSTQTEEPESTSPSTMSPIDGDIIQTSDSSTQVQESESPENTSIWKFSLLLIFFILVQVFVRCTFNGQCSSQPGTFDLAQEPVLMNDACHLSLKAFIPSTSSISNNICSADYGNLSSTELLPALHLDDLAGLSATVASDDGGIVPPPSPPHLSRSWLWKFVVMGTARGRVWDGVVERRAPL